jgi:large subunit ribosomal protein L3
MGKFSHPRRGSRQFAPRNRAKSEVPRIRTWVQKEGKKVLGFAGYKVAITHAELIENNPKSVLVNQPRQEPVTLVQMPPMKVIGVRYYLGDCAVGQMFAPNLHKDLGRTIRPLPKENPKPKEIPAFDRVVIIVSMQPRLAGFGKKKPEVMEMALAGSPEEQKKSAEELIGKDLRASDVLTVGDYLDVFAISKGKGFMGPIKRSGVPLMSVKTKRSRRRPANIGSWRPKRVIWGTPMSGRTGYHQRCDYNKRVVAISDKGLPQGFHHYGKVDGDFVLIQGSLPGAIKRLVRVRFAARQPERIFDAQKLESVAIGGFEK